jgi:predicted HTH domain antitoxin
MKGIPQMTTLQIEFPEDVIALPGYNQTSLEKLAREALLVRLYAEQSIASHRAAQILGITRDAFIQLLVHYGVAKQDESTELEAEILRQTQLIKPITAIGRKLVETRARLIVSGTPLLDWDEIQQEVVDRRGGLESRDV